VAAQALQLGQVLGHLVAVEHAFEGQEPVLLVAPEVDDVERAVLGGSVDDRVLAGEQTGLGEDPAGVEVFVDGCGVGSGGHGSFPRRFRGPAGTEAGRFSRGFDAGS